MTSQKLDARPSPASENPGEERPRTVLDSFGCPCEFGGGIRGPGHDWILGLEDRGIEGVVDLINRFEITLDGEAENFGFDPIPTWDLPALVARHNWRQPAVVVRLVNFVVKAERARRGVAS